MRSHKEKKTIKSKAKSTLFASVTTVFMEIMALTIPKHIWNYLKKEFSSDERIRGMNVLNLMRKFELQRMKESQTLKEYLDIVNKVRLLYNEFKNTRIVKKKKFLL